MTMMPRIRTVKPELFMHEGLFELAKNYQWPVQLVFVGLFTCCDREGRFCWHPRRLKACILPYHDVDMSEVLEVFVTHGFVKKYTHQGVRYGCIPSWSKHQRTENEAESILPPPDDPNWVKPLVKPEPKKTHFVHRELKTNDAFLPPFLPIPPPETENKNIIKNNGFKSEKSPAPRACARRLRGTRGFRAKKEGKGMEGKGKEGKGKEREKQNIVTFEPPASLAEDPVSLIFNHWRTVMEHPAAKLDSQRKSMIQCALKWDYSTEELCQAITGCSLTPHNRGENDRNERYDGLHIILKNCDQIDRFIKNYHYPPRLMTEANRKTYANVQSLQRWVNKKMMEETTNAEG